MTHATAGDAPTGTGNPPGPASSRGRLLRTGALLASLALVVSAALLVPMPLVEAAPGGVTEIPPLIEVQGPTTDVTGQVGLLTVRVDQPSIAETVRAWIDDDRTLRRRDEVVPRMLDHRSYLVLQQGEFRRAFRVAAALGLRAAGYEVGITTAPQVAGIHPGGPADGALRLGDVILRFNGQPVVSADELARLTQQSAVGDEIVLDVRRDGAAVEVTIRAGRVPGLDHPGMGITLQTLEEDIDLPFDVTLVDQRDIGGPSAGLMVALTVYDLVADEDLVDGRRIAGTGTVDGTGTVGRIGSIREKTLTAVAADVDLMLVPASQLTEARDAARGRVEVVGVETLTEALEALRR